MIHLKPYTCELVHQFFQNFRVDPLIYERDADVKPFQYSPQFADQYYANKVCDPSRIYFAIMLEEQIIGEICLKHINEQKTHGTLSIQLQQDHIKNKGYGTIAEQLLIQYAFEEMHLECIYADTIHRNNRSRHVLEKLGFRFIRQDALLRYYELRNPSLQPISGS